MARNKPKHIKYNNHKIKQMKNNNYIKPAIDLVELEVEQGIAMSTQELGGFGNIDIPEEDVMW